MIILMFIDFNMFSIGNFLESILYRIYVKIIRFFIIGLEDID